MVRKEKIKDVVAVLKNANRLQRNELVRRIVDADLMSHMTASNAIDEAVKSNKIIREEAKKGNQKIVFYSVYSDIAENEQSLFDNMTKWLKQYDIRFTFFKQNYASLSIEEKAEGLVAFFQMQLNFHVAVQALWHNFGKTNEWTSLLKEIQSRDIPLNKLMTSGSKKEHGEIAKFFIESKIEFLNESIERLDENLNKIKDR